MQVTIEHNQSTLEHIPCPACTIVTVKPFYDLTTLTLIYLAQACTTKQLMVLLGVVGKNAQHTHGVITLLILHNDLNIIAITTIIQN